MREQFPVFDLHCDTAVELSRQKKALASNDLHIDLDRADRLLTHHQFYAFCCVYGRDGKPLPQAEAEARFYAEAADFYSQISGNASRVRLCRPSTCSSVTACSRQSLPPLLWLSSSGCRLSMACANRASALSPASNSSNRAVSSSA